MKPVQTTQTLATVQSPAAAVYALVEKILVRLHADGFATDPAQQAAVDAMLAGFFRLIVLLNLPHAETVKAAKAVSYYRKSLNMPLMVSREMARFTKRLLTLTQWTPTQLAAAQPPENFEPEANDDNDVAEHTPGVATQTRADRQLFLGI